ncbi:MAG: hypothetical protein WDN69_20260 [Aliidongia sp.]
MFRTSFGPYLASRYEDVATVLRDKRFGKDFEARIIRRYGEKVFDEPIYDSVRRWMLERDPPDHTRLRGLVVKAFTARTVEDMRPRIQAIVDATLDRIAPQGRMDIVRDFAYPLPVTVICEMLGIPEEDHAQFQANPGVGGRLLDPVPPDPGRNRHRQQGASGAGSLFPQPVRTAPARAGQRSDHPARPGRGGR